MYEESMWKKLNFFQSSFCWEKNVQNVEATKKKKREGIFIRKLYIIASHNHGCIRMK